MIVIIGGTGPQGLGIAKRFAIAGIPVIVGSRKEEKAVKIVEETKEELKDYDIAEITGMANEDAAKASDILILTVPLTAQKPTIQGIKEDCKNKIFIDATVPLEAAVGGLPSYPIQVKEGSAAKRTDALLKGTGAKVVAAFHNISNSLLLNIPEPIDCDCLIAGDDKEAKDTVIELVEKIPGIRGIDVGPLEKAHMIETITPLLIGLNIKYKSHYGGIRITGIPKIEKE